MKDSITFDEVMNLTAGMYCDKLKAKDDNNDTLWRYYSGMYNGMVTVLANFIDIDILYNEETWTKQYHELRQETVRLGEEKYKRIYEKN